MVGGGGVLDVVFSSQCSRVGTLLIVNGLIKYCGGWWVGVLDIVLFLFQLVFHNWINNGYVQSITLNNPYKKNS